MSSDERITWTNGKWAEVGSVNGLRLFTVGYGTRKQDGFMYYLDTTLPAKSSAIGQHYPTPTHAKVAAERFLRAFIERITTNDTPRAEQGAEGDGVRHG